MKFETERLMIIPCTEQTITPEIKEEYTCGPHIIRHLNALKEDPALLYWGVWLVKHKSTGNIVGDIGFKGKPDENKVVEIGYGFLETCWNKGYATEALTALIHWAIHTSEVHKMIAETHLDNPASMRVLEKINMQKKGTDGSNALLGVRFEGYKQVKPLFPYPLINQPKKQ